MREIRRRARVVNAFPDAKSVLMSVMARPSLVAGRQWGTRYYLDMDRPQEPLEFGAENELTLVTKMKNHWNLKHDDRSAAGASSLGGLADRYTHVKNASAQRQPKVKFPQDGGRFPV